MMNWKWNMPLQVTFRVYSSQDIFQIITFQCAMFTTGNCCWLWFLQSPPLQECALHCWQPLRGTWAAALAYNLLLSSPGELSPVHSQGAKAPLELASARAMVWEENHANQKATGQKSLCWDFCKLRKACLPPCSVCSCSHIPHLKRRALGILQGGTSLHLPGEGMAPWSGWSVPVGHKAGFKISLRPSYFTNNITVSTHIFYLADDTRTQLFLKAFSEAFIFSLCFSPESSALKTERIA